MNKEHLSDEDDFDEILSYATQLMVNEKKTPTEIQQILEDQGLSPAGAGHVADCLQGEINDVQKEAGQRDMFWGAVWCIGGTIATLMDIGYIFWGAIVFGGIQFFRGLTNYNS